MFLKCHHLQRHYVFARVFLSRYLQHNLCKKFYQNDNVTCQFYQNTWIILVEIYTFVELFVNRMPFFIILSHFEKAFYKLTNQSPYLLDAVGLSQIFFPTQNIDRAY